MAAINKRVFATILEEDDIAVFGKLLPHYDMAMLWHTVSSNFISNTWVEKSCACLKEMFINGFDPNTIDLENRTPLHWAAIRSDVRLMEYILKLDNVDVNLQDNMGDTFMHLCFEEIGYDRILNEDIEEILCKAHEKGFDFNIKNNAGKTITQMCSGRKFIKDIIIKLENTYPGKVIIE